MDTIDVNGEAHLECETTSCEHNVGRTTADGQELRLCGFTTALWIRGEKPIRDCSRKAAIVNLFAKQGWSPHRFDEEEGARVFDDMFYPPEDPQEDSG